MRIGLDFDNTVVAYDAAFHRVATERGLIPEGLARTKVAVRDHLRAIGHEALWTEMQGYVYGARMHEAEPYPGAKAFLRWARQRGHSLCVVSHKTRYPFAGPRYDLHDAARAWVVARLVDASGPLVDPSAVYFERTQAEKLARIAATGCAAFVDDLPEILQAPGFPAGTEPLLFDPERRYEGSGLRTLRSFEELRQVIEERWPSRA